MKDEDLYEELKKTRISLEKEVRKRKQTEERLQDREEKLKILFEFAPDAYGIMDLKGNFLYCNKAVEVLTGYRREELVGKDFGALKLLPLNQLSKATSILTRDTLIKHAGPYEFTLNRKDGSQAQVEIRAHPVNIKGRTLVLAITRDITERKLNEEALQKSKDLLTNVFESMKEGILVLDKEYKYTYWNKGMERISNTPSKEIIGTIPWKKFPVVKKQIKEAMESAMKGDSVLDVEFRYRLSSEKEGWTSESYFPLKDTDENIVGVVGVIEDITDRKQTEDILEAQRARLNSLFTYSGEAIALFDLENHIMETNPAFEKIFGYSAEETRGKIIEDLICPERFYHTESKELDDQAMHGIRGIEIIRRRKDGTEINVRVSAGPIKIGGTITGRFAVFDDITEQKRAEEALQRERDKLKDALDNVKTLHGLIPICAHCKKIRDDKGYWNQIESYIHDHSEADFSHSICPECERELYPDYYEDD